MKRSVALLVVGDPKVGKSSLISTYISRHFGEVVPSVMTDAALPYDLTASAVCVTIMDSSPSEAEREDLIRKIQAADCILALYDVTSAQSLESLGSVWLPLIRAVNSGCPKDKAVLVVGTKIDLLEDGLAEDLRPREEEMRLKSLLSEFTFAIECCRYRSYNTPQNIC